MTIAVTSRITDPTWIAISQIIAGVIIAFASVAVSALLERWASNRETARKSIEAAAAEAARYDAIVRGERSDRSTT